MTIHFFLFFTEAMVANYGMSDKIGLLNFGQNDASSQFYKPYSTLANLATQKLADKIIRKGHTHTHLDRMCDVWWIKGPNVYRLS